MTVLTIVQAVTDGLRAEMAIDKDVIVYGQDVGFEGGVFRATLGIQEEFGVKRCFDSPLAESGIAGTAMGMAMAGLKPVVEMQFSGFAWPAMNQIVTQISRMRNRTRGAQTCPLVIRMPYGGGIRALEHHSESMESIWGHIPGLKVVIPSTPYDTKGLLIAAIRDKDPVIFMEPKRTYRSIKQEVPEEAYALEIGKAKVVFEGSDITLVSYGAQMKEAMEARAALEKDGVSVELIDLRTIYPFDKKTITESVMKTGRFMIVHEGPKSFGVGAEIISHVTKDCFTYLEAPPERLCGADTIFPLPKTEHFYLITTDHIVSKVKEVIKYIP